MRRVNWTITERQHQELKRLSRETGLPISELVRRALDKYLGLLGEEAPPEELAARPEPTGEREVRT
jgi:16S rRNA U516 pseudouridylate synthase RsuA-like enzyme